MAIGIVSSVIGGIIVYVLTKVFEHWWRHR